MRRRPRCRPSWIALALAALAFGGCLPNAPKLELGVLLQVKTGPTSYAVVLETRAVSEVPVQAFDLDYSLTTSSKVARMTSYNHAGFDDDSRLFRSPLFDELTKTLQGVVDVRHGPGTALVGTVPLAIVVLLIDDAQPATVRVSGRIAGPDGVVHAALASGPLSLPVFTQ